MGAISDVIGDYGSSIKRNERAAAITPYSKELWMHLDMTERRKGDQKASDAVARKIIEIGAREYDVNNEDLLVLSRMAIRYARFGERDKALAAVRRVLDIALNDGLAMLNCACTCNGLGMKSETLQYLRRLLEIGGNVVREWVKTDPYFDSLREDPEYETLIAEFA